MPIKLNKAIITYSCKYFEGRFSSCYDLKMYMIQEMFLMKFELQIHAKGT